MNGTIIDLRDALREPGENPLELGRYNKHDVDAVIDRIVLKADGQAVVSSTRLDTGQYIAGPTYNVDVNRNGRAFNLFFNFSDASPGFTTETARAP